MTICVQTCFLTISIHNKLYDQVVIPMESQQYTKFMLYCKNIYSTNTEVRYPFFFESDEIPLFSWRFVCVCVCTTNLHQLGMKNAAVATSSFFAPGYNPAICTQRSEGAKRGLSKVEGSKPAETAGLLGYPTRPNFCKTPEHGCKIDPGHRTTRCQQCEKGQVFLAFHCPRYQCVFSWADIVFPNPRSFAQFQVLCIE